MPAKKRTPASRPKSSAPRRRPKSPATRPPSVLQHPPDPRLVEGVALYNHHQFFQCHEVLEQLWLETHGSSKDFYKGLIQAAVAFYHWSRGNVAGAKTLACSASRYLERYRSVSCGLDVERFAAQFSELFRWLRRHRQRYDVHLVPTLRWITPPR